jgi:hypothetical protein
MENPILLSAHYLPCVQWFAKWLHEPCLIEQYGNYNKGSYRNRCHILGANGLLRLSIPLAKGKHQQMPVREVRISDHLNWRREHWQSIRSAYGKAPFFDYYADRLAPLFEKKATFLFDMNILFTQTLLELLGQDPLLQFTESFEEGALGRDFRKGISPKPSHQIPDPAFHPVEYPQAFAERHGFIPNVSVIDLLFCTGPEAPIYIAESLG